jgi:hypothetical protein
MTFSIDDFIDNNYFNSYFVAYEMPKYFKGGEPEIAFENIKAVYQKLDLENLSEAQLEEEFIKKVLENLGYSFAYQVNKKIFGKNYKPDFALFESEAAKIEHLKENSLVSNQNILALVKCKSYKNKIDNGKETDENPHYKLLSYLVDLKVNIGILTNGKFWRLIDISKFQREKTYFQIDLEKLLQNNDFEGFMYFYYIFEKSKFYKSYTNF